MVRPDMGRGVIFILLRNRANFLQSPSFHLCCGYVRDIAFSYIDGENVYIQSSGIFTDTALTPGSVGPFDVSTSVEYATATNISFKSDWWDAIIQDGIVIDAIEVKQEDDLESEKTYQKHKNTRIDQIHKRCGDGSPMVQILNP